MELLFVCTGNTCRSAMAEAIARRYQAQRPQAQQALHIGSAGVLCAGPSPANDKAIAAAERHGCDLSQFTARQLTPELMEAADLILVMTQSHRQMLQAAFPQQAGKVFLLAAYAQGTPDAIEIPDPYGGSQQQYDQCFAVLEEAVCAVLEKLV